MNLNSFKRLYALLLQMNDTILRMHNITAKTQHWHIRKSKIQPQTIWQKFIKVESNKTTASLLGFFLLFQHKAHMDD